MKLIKTRYAVINALFVGALLSTGCPGKTGPSGALTQVSVKGGKSRPQPTSTNPDASKPTPTPLPTGTPDGPQPQIPPVPSVDPSATPTPDLTPITKGASLLGGLVAAPASLISNNGGSIISNNGSAIISNNGGAIISNNGGAIISNNGGAIISNNGLGYHVFDAAGPEGILKNAFLYLADRDEKFFLDSQKKKVFTSTTDASGNYRFDITADNGFPVNKDVVVNALINGNLRMTGYLVPIDGDNQLKLNLATTLATEYLRADAYRNGKTLRAYNRDLFYTTASMTQQAINTGDISAVATVKNHDGTNVTVGTFDLRIDHVFNLRNQYAIAISAVNKANAAIKAISDNWKTLLGYRPSSVTTFAGNGNQPSVNPAWDSSYAAIGGVEGDWNVSGKQTPAPQVPLGYVYDVAVAKRGDIFICGYTEKANSGFVRWIKPNGEVSSLWLPTYTIGGPTGICVETEPTDPPATPGTVLVTDHFNHRVLRIPIVDYRPDRVGGDGYEQFKMDLVAGYDTPYTPGANGSFTPGVDYTLTSEFTDPENPMFVDCDRNLTTMNPVDVFGTEMTQYDLNAYPADYKNPVKWGYDKSTSVTPATSRWRLRDEGERVYEVGNTSADGSAKGVDVAATGVSFKKDDKVPHPARYAFLNEPWDVCVDEMGNIYIADKSNHRVRMIPKKDGQYFGWCQPMDDGTHGGAAPNDNIIDWYDTSKTTMKAGCIYTIVGDPTWDASKSKTTNIGGYWFGEYLLNGSPSDNMAAGSAQKAHLDQPYSVAFDNTKHVLYICDRDNERIRAVSRDTGAIWTAAGNTDGMAQRGTTDRDYAPADLSGTKTGGDGGSAKSAQLAFPKGITVDGAGRLYIADTNSGRIRMVDTNGVINTIAGRKHDPNSVNPTDNVTDGDSLLWVDLWDTEGLGVDKDGNVLMCDFRHKRIRKLWRQWE